MPQLHKISQSAALYVPPEIIGRDGVRCGNCVLFCPRERTCLILTPSDSIVDSRKGVCGYFAPGQTASFNEGHGRLSREQAGYAEVAPTRCGSCEYIGNSPGLPQGYHPCRRVEGMINENGCCALWSHE